MRKTRSEDSMTKLEKGQVLFDQLITIKTAHDVRRLAICSHCRNMGSQLSMIDTPAPIGDGRLEFWHGRCFAKHIGMTRLLELPPEKTARLALGDLGVDLMKRLLAVTAGERTK